MGDKYRSEIHKPVNNPLLSGAGHGFPFDTFHGNSLLVPVSQDNSSVLNDPIGEPDKFLGQDNAVSEVKNRSSDASNVVPEPKNDQSAGAQTSSANASYVRLFTSLFGNSQSKQEQEPVQDGRAKSVSSDQPSASSISSSPRSFSPHIPLPTFQTVIPALEVPLLAFSSSNTPPSDVADPVYSSRTPLHPPRPSQSQTESRVSSNATGDAPTRSGAAVDFTGTDISFADHFSNAQSVSSLTERPPQQPQANFVASGADLSQISDRSTQKFTGVPKSDSNPEFRGPPYPFPPSSASFPQPSSIPSSYQSSDATRGAYPPPSFGQPYGIPPVQNMQFTETPNHYGLPGLDGIGSRPPLAASNAPPLFSGDASGPKTYRLSHSKRPVYAPIPGLTLSTPPTAAPVLQTTEVRSTTSAPPSFYTLPHLMGGNQTQQQPPPPTPTANVSNVTSKPSVISQPEVPSAASYFKGPDSFQSDIIQPVPLASPSPVTCPSAPPTQSCSLPYPVPAAAGHEKQSLFAPISKANPNLPDGNPPPVFNPVAIHPSATPTTVAATVPNQAISSLSVEENAISPVIIPPSLNHLAHVGRSGIGYRPPYHHWFYRKELDSKDIWQPFSMTDSVALEQTYQSGKLDENTVVSTDGGRYDVSIMKRLRCSVYWKETPREVRRCSWFYKNPNDTRYRPYEENTAFHLEEEYKKCVTTNTWKKRIDMKEGEYIVIYGPSRISHFERSFAIPDGWEDGLEGTQPVPFPVKTVKRGVSDEFDIDDGEASKVDHLVFVVHGIGSVCDLKFRTIEEAGMDDFVDVSRTLSHQLIKTHFSNSNKQGLVNRIEILPISWHSHLHGETTGLDKKLESISLKSIPRLRNFTNDTLLDILFYTSPVYCQNIVQQVGHEINEIFKKFKSRNANFNGGVSLVGHSLGSLILFDMLHHQKPSTQTQATAESDAQTDEKLGTELIRRTSAFEVGTAGTGSPSIKYPQLAFHPVAFFALGSPIGMFVTVRGIHSLGLDFKLPTCDRFFNIFHPFDPVAYRIEPLVNPELSEKRPLLIPHHKGRKRMHLELRETIGRVGADLKQRLVDSIRSTWNTVYQLTSFGRADDDLEQEVDQVIEKQMMKQMRTEGAVSGLNESDSLDCDLGCLNMGRRIDHVLQEAPLESVNEYVSAIRSHLIYWDSEDTVLMIMKEAYAALGIAPDRESASQDVPGTTTPPSPPSPSALSVSWNPSEFYSNKDIHVCPTPSHGSITT